jgi:hypothetical protein
MLRPLLPLLILAAVPAFAEDSSTETQRLLQDTKIREVAPPKKGPGTTMTCRDRNGKMLDQGQEGYEDCLQDASTDAPKPKAPGLSPQNTAAPGFRIGK